jgi:hypothetical protein
MEVKLPSGDFIRSAHTTTVDIPALTIATREARIIPNNFQHSILSVGQRCDNGCEINFLAQNRTVKLNGYIILVGRRDNATWLWRFNLIASPSEVNLTPEEAYTVYEQRSIEDSIAYLHDKCFSPIKDTWLKAIEVGIFVGFSGLVPDRVRKCGPSTKQIHQ